MQIQQSFMHTFAPLLHTVFFIHPFISNSFIRLVRWIEYDCLTQQILGFPAEQLIDMDMRELIERYKGDHTLPTLAYEVSSYSE